MLPRPAVRSRGAYKRQVVALCPAGCEEYLLFLNFPQLRQSFLGLLYILLCFHTFRMHGGWIAIVIAHHLAYKVPHAFISFRSCRIVQIYFSHNSTSCFLFSIIDYVITPQDGT